jgi:hypothetical protein
VQRSKEIDSNAVNDDDPNFDHEFDLVTDGAHAFVKEHLLTKITRKNLQIIVDYIMAFQTDAGPSQQYRVDTIYKLQLDEYHHPKSFHDLTRQDIVEFLDHYRKPESVDALHRWVRARGMHF